MKRLAILLGAVLILAACGGGGGGGGGSTAAITKVWTDFFSSTVGVSTKPAMIQNGSQFTKQINALASSPLAKHTSAKVSKVTLEGSTKATVVYSIYLGNTAALKNQTGTALKENGSWVISDLSLCSLLQLEGQTGLPQVCAK